VNGAIPVLHVFAIAFHLTAIASIKSSKAIAGYRGARDQPDCLPELGSVLNLRYVVFVTDAGVRGEAGERGD
jgi:hypothetical protein